MKEDFLHYLWEFQKWKQPGLKTSEEMELLILSPGTHNFLSGPDFFNSRLVIGNQKWAGNVEIHINSSDWYAHHHETDTNYDNVILHVVWNHDAEVFRKDNSVIPVFELKSVVSSGTLSNYENLLKSSSGRWINCEKDFGLTDDFYLKNWLERLYFERLEEKAALIFKLLKRSSNNWEEVLFKLLAKNFGLNVNGESFLSVAASIPFGAIRKMQRKEQNLEAVFLGQAGILEQRIEESYYKDLQETYAFLMHKYGLSSQGVQPVRYFRLRPDNFPSLRLVQLASLYSRRTGLFSEVIGAGTLKELQSLFEVEVPEFWETHYTFEKSHGRRKKPVTRQFIELLIINTLVPIKFCYAATQGKEINEELLELMTSLKTESNSIIKKFNELRPGSAVSALDSQGLLQMKKQYCDKNRCLKCSLGIKLLQKEAQK